MRMSAKLCEIKVELLRRRHQPIPEQRRWLEQVMRGYFAYHGVPSNEKALLTEPWVTDAREEGGTSRRA